MPWPSAARLAFSLAFPAHLEKRHCEENSLTGPIKVGLGFFQSLEAQAFQRRFLCVADAR
jgi:hypothetical protein